MTTKSVRNMKIAKISGTNFLKVVDTLHGRLVLVLQLFEIDIYNWFKHYIYIYIYIYLENTTLHVLSHGGHDFLEQKLIKEKQKKWLDQATQFGGTETIVGPPSPIRRYMKWKMSCTKKIRSDDI